uniref:FERM domain-containing protein 8 n=1 Tax=Panagrolaimus superbus TaxID=310955 RepID=A0A914YX87_9BILA
MNHGNLRKLSEQRGIHLPFDMADIKRTMSAQPCLSATDDLSPVSRVTSDKSLPNERSLSDSHSFVQRSSESNGKTLQLMDIRIFFSDGKCVQFTVEGGSEARASDLLELVAEHLNIPEDIAHEVFALWLTSPLLEVQLKPQHVAADIHTKWPSFLRKYTYANEADIVYDEPLLILKRKVSLSTEMEKKYIQDCENVVDVLYLDAKDEYLSGRYLVDVETALDLAALQILIEYGPYDGKDEEILDLVHVRLPEFVPSQHLSHVRSFQLFGLSIMECKAGLEKDVFQRYKEFSLLYGDQCSPFFDGKTDRRSSSMPLLDFGRRFFTGFTPTAKMNVRIGIQSSHITVVDPVKQEILLTQKIEDCSWLSNKDNNAPEFFLHFPDPAFINRHQISHRVAENGQNFAAPQSKILQIFSKQTCMMVALLDSLDEIATSELGSAHDLHQDHPIVLSDHDNSCLASSDEADSTTYSPNTTVTESLTQSKAPSTVGSRSTHTSSSSSSRDSIYSNCKLSKLCLATLDPKGCCVEVQGSLKKLLVPVH